MRVIFSREKGFMGRGNPIQNSLQLTPFNRSREREREVEFREIRIDLISSLSNELRKVFSIHSFVNLPN